jgi:hypothetical protein
MIERDIEQYLIKQINQCGGHIFKWSSPGNRGVPDRIVFINRQVWFIELKRPREKRDIQQIVVGKIIKRFTPNYLVISTKENIDLFIVSIMVNR